MRHNKIDELLKWYEQELIDWKDITSGDTEANTDDAASDTSDEENLEESGQSSSDPSLLTSEQIFIIAKLTTSDFSIRTTTLFSYHIRLSKSQQWLEDPFRLHVSVALGRIREQNECALQLVAQQQVF